MKGITLESIKNQYASNAASLLTMLNKAKLTGKKVNGYTIDQLTEMYDRYNAMATGKLPFLTPAP